MAEPGQKTNRSLDRGIDILEALTFGGPQSLSDLSRSTGLPVSTTKRLLATMCDRKFVRRSTADKKYRSAVSIHVSSTSPMQPADYRFIDIVMTELQDLTDRIKWPSDVHVMEHTFMRFVDTTRPKSPHYVVPATLDRKLNIFGSATGQACLAQLPENIVNHLIELTNDDPIFGLGRLNFTPQRLHEELRKTRERGYGIRLFPFLGETVVADNLSAIAVSITSPTGMTVGIPLVFPSTLMSTQDFASEFKDPLIKTALKIEQRMLRT